MSDYDRYERRRRQWENRERDGYAYHAGDPGPGPNFHQLRRDVRNKSVAGVCAGFARYFGWDLKAIRFFTFLGMLFSMPFGLVVYFAAAILIKPDQGISTSHSPEEERFWRTFSVKPRATFSELKHRFRALDMRISDMEQAVTSNEFGLRKAFEDLERSGK